MRRMIVLNLNRLSKSIGLRPHLFSTFVFPFVFLEKYLSLGFQDVVVNRFGRVICSSRHITPDFINDILVSGSKENNRGICGSRIGAQLFAYFKTVQVKCWVYYGADGRFICS